MSKLNLMKWVFACMAVIGFISACQPPKTISTNTSVVLEQQTAILATQKASEIPVQVETATPVPTPNEVEIRTAIIETLLKLYNEANRMDVTTVLSATKTSTNVIEFQPPDRKRIISDESETIVAGGKVYLKKGGSEQWQETQTPAATYLGDVNMTKEMLAETIETAQYLRHDTLQDHPVIVYSYSSTTKMEEYAIPTQTELWIGVGDGLLYKMIVVGGILSVSYDPDSGITEWQVIRALTTIGITFDPTIRIELPNIE